MARTVMDFFDAKNRENKNLILAIVLCRNFIFKELVHWYYLQEKKKIQIYCFFSELMYTGNQYISIRILKRNS